ncbi:IGF-like family receptor 1 isoform X2 [Hypomesus transpacificus]|uniref:IGF-like family receptor 1 isoform X2 n=1 Tax=Hypomesus transpacificus TaxID=137520 RepID=UPI001F07B1BE|nr:IGF-like family receptor 1 isoform X2 [Hypomesus transpacificus]
MYSERCKPNRNTYWNDGFQQCQQCKSRFPLKAGYEFSPNCGFDDQGGRHETPYVPCNPQTFNNGSFVECQSCTICSVKTIHKCNTTVDAQCCEGEEDGCGLGFTTKRTTLASTLGSTTKLPQFTSVTPKHFLGFVFWKRKQKHRYPCCKDNKKQPNCTPITIEEDPLYNGHYTNHYATQSQVEKQDTLSLEIQSAPLQIVLENLDVLEELVILLDPERPGVKNTTHLASRCSFPSTWITYTYSLRATRSPLKAVLEGVTTRNPDWTVGHLAQLLKEMDRNDAVAVLTKLSLAQEISFLPQYNFTE